MACREIEKKCQAAGARLPVEFDWTASSSSYWVAGEVRGLGEVIRPSAYNGFQYRYTSAGQAGAKEPKFAKAGEIVGATYQDGAAVLTAELISNDSLARVIDASTWEPVSGLAIDDDGLQNTDGEQKTWIYVQGAEPGVFRLRNTVTFTNGEIDVGEVDIEVE